MKFVYFFFFFFQAEDGIRDADVTGVQTCALPILGEDWRVRIPRDLATLARAWRDPAAWAGTTRIAGSDGPAEIIGLSAADELVVHGWDVARSTGQPYACEPELLAAAESFLALFASPDAPAGPDVAFGPSREVRVGAPELDRVVALAGRDLGWSPG